MADKFESGDRVFAKIKGWPPWPAKVLNRAEGKAVAYVIQFYGTYDLSTVKPDNIFVYNESNKVKYGKPKNNTRWKEAMEEIENNTPIGDNGPIEEQQQEEQEPEKMAVDAEVDTDGDGELMIDEGPEPPVLAKEGGKLNSSLNGKPEQPKGRRGSKASLSKRDSISSTTSIPEVSTPTANAGPSTEIVSRSGRKIKPKRFADDEIPTKSTPAKNKASNHEEGVEPPSKRAKRGGKTPPSTKATPTPAMETREPVRSGPRMVIGKGKGAPSKPASGRLSPDISSPVPRAPALTRGAQAAPNMQRRSEPASALPTRKPLPALIPAATSGPPALQQAPPTEFRRRAPSLREQSKSEIIDEEPEYDDPSDLVMNGDDVEADDKENVKDCPVSSNGSEIESESEMEKNSEIDEETSSRHSEIIEAYDESLQRIAFTDKEGDQFEVRFEAKEEFETEEERLDYVAVMNQVEKVKDDLEQGDQDTSETIQDLLEVSKDEYDNEEALIRERRAQQIRILRVEGEVIEIIGEIVSCLGEKQAECFRAIELLDRLGSHELSPLILKKHPEVVHTVARLRSYVGNIEQWEMNEAQTIEFKDNATAIRLKAADIYSNFYNIFVAPEEQHESVTFEEIFQEEMKLFRQMTQGLTVDDILGLTAETEDGNFEMFDAGEIEA